MGIAASLLLHFAVVGFFFNQSKPVQVQNAGDLQVSVQNPQFGSAHSQAGSDFSVKVGGTSLKAHPTDLPQKSEMQTESVSSTPSAREGASGLARAEGDAPMAEGMGIHAVYPRMSRILGEEGSVVLQIRRDALAHVIGAEVLHSSGFPRLDESAIKAIRTAIVSGQDLSVLGGKTTFVFKLNQ